MVYILFRARIFQRSNINNIDKRIAKTQFQMVGVGALMLQYDAIYELRLEILTHHIYGPYRLLRETDYYKVTPWLAKRLEDYNEWVDSDTLYFNKFNWIIVSPDPEHFDKIIWNIVVGEESKMNTKWKRPE